MELLKNVSKWGNSAGVLLPREWIGNQVKIVLIDRTLEIKKEVFNILDSYLNDILGVYLTGSYVRGEQEDDSDIDIIAISNKTKKDIVSGRYNVSILTLDSLKKTLEKNPILILPRLNEAKPIFNQPLLEELKATRVSVKSFNEYLNECKRIIRINKGLLSLNEDQSPEYLDSPEIIYSIILRLRGVFLIKSIIDKRPYSKKGFLDWLKKLIEEKELKNSYENYKAIRDNKKAKCKVKVETSLVLLNFLEKEVINYEKREKT